jgi:hypothetical protein
MNTFIRLLGQALFICTVSAFALETGAKSVAGYIEKVRVYPGGILIRAKLDTGAKTSSLNVPQLEYFLRDGRRWVRFTVTNWNEKTTTIDLPMMRIAKIKRHFGRIQERPVVHLGICLGNVYAQTEVNLVNRAGYNYQMLIGRRFLEHRFVVDPDLYYTLKPACTAKQTGKQ